jgi:hypothetical protein
MKQPVAKLLIGFFIVVALLVVVMTIFTLSQPVPAPPPLPNPNGYDDLVKAGGMVTDDSWNYSTMSEEELQAFVKKNAEALKLARVGLNRKCCVPLDCSPTNATRSGPLAAIKRLTQAIMSEGRLAELENRPADAAEAYLAVIHLGCAMSQGGVIIDSLVGLAVETLGMAPLEKLASNLDAKQCREVASALEIAESGRETTDTILRREHTWAWQTYGFKGRIERLLMFRDLYQIEQRLATKVQRQQTRTRALLIQLAARAYELEKGARPKALAELVPAYLKTIPQDPLTGTNMAYRP